MGCYRQYSAQGHAVLRTAAGCVAFENVAGDVYVRGPADSYVCKLYKSLFQSIIIALATSAAPVARMQSCSSD
jgi:hypothetical protein